MPLVNCNDCGSSHSDKAKACPKCGNPSPLAEKHKQANTGVVLAAVTLIAGLLTTVVIAGC